MSATRFPDKGVSSPVNSSFSSFDSIPEVAEVKMAAVFQNRIHVLPLSGGSGAQIVPLESQDSMSRSYSDVLKPDEVNSIFKAVSGKYFRPETAAPSCVPSLAVGTDQMSRPDPSAHGDWVVIPSETSLKVAANSVPEQPMGSLDSGQNPEALLTQNQKCSPSDSCI